MLGTNSLSLRNALGKVGNLSDRFVVDAESSIPWSEMLSGSVLLSRGDELCGRSVLVSTRDQITTVVALMELDGVARRIVLCPPDLSFEAFPHVIETAEVDTIVSDKAVLQIGKPRPMLFSPCTRKVEPANHDHTTYYETEWVLLTSGTTGLPKLVTHTLSSLTDAIQRGNQLHEPVIWGTFYDIRRYGGLQIFLRAALTGTSLILSNGQESTTDFLTRAAAWGITHLTGTPSHWRRALMSPSIQLIKPRYVRLSGEIADQAILSQLQLVYPDAQLVHAFASTEAGVAFEVHDRMAGFPSSLIDGTSGVDMKVEGNTLRIRSARNASRYLEEDAPKLKGLDGYVDTGDIVELREGRYYFAGRRDGVINVGGLKVYPEEIEAVINRHPKVQMSVVRAKKSPITGALVVADVQLKSDVSCAGADMNAIQDDILLLCRETLSSYKVPVAIKVVSSLGVSDSGKVMRRDA
jgi:acyl-coenzyme A synthetase/AMP-(fatty) acid ligase